VTLDVASFITTHCSGAPNHGYTRTSAFGVGLLGTAILTCTAQQGGYAQTPCSTTRRLFSLPLLPHIMTTVVPRRVPNTNPDPEAPLVATAVSNTCVEVMTHLWNPGDVELVSVLVRDFFYPRLTSPHWSLVHRRLRWCFPLASTSDFPDMNTVVKPTNLVPKHRY